MSSETRQRLRLTIRGAVQGVGFRPFLYRLAEELCLDGWVANTASGVIVEAEGPSAVLQEFLLRAGRDHPERARMHSLEPSFLDPAGYSGFEIRESQGGETGAWISPDIATCADCRCDLFDPADRRYRYPFINCTNCGPRYSIIERLPYDRAHTSMRKFTMCPACQAEYDEPRDRRFHAQPNACPVCGPQLQLWDRGGKALAGRDEALRQAAESVRAGQVLALKGLGGFHLIADATNAGAVRTLRERKQRQGKPLALMFPDLASVKAACGVSPLEERLLASPESPIVLLRRAAPAGIAEDVAPGNPYLGAMLPYSPLHILLLQELGRPVVATSGNLSEETICYDEHEALRRLGGLADLFLVHDRPIVRAVDDTVARVILGTEQLIRRARGYAPLPLLAPRDLPPALAVGGHLKNCVAVSKGRGVFLSQHIGDIETAQSCNAFHKVVADLRALYQVDPKIVVCDRHPGYYSTQAARSLGLPVREVQHHEAHVLACLAENEVTLPALGVSWDGSGYGTDGTVWGGEFILATEEGCRRFAHFENFPLPGGEAAVREPRRSLLGALYAAFGEEAFAPGLSRYLPPFTPAELEALRQMLVKRINSPLTSSVGRRFDAVSALSGLCGVSSFEGQAAMALEFALPADTSDKAYTFQINGQGDDRPLIIRAPLWDEVLADVKAEAGPAVISAKFHNMLIDIIVSCAKLSGSSRAALTGGCFQNRCLTERAAVRLREAGVQPYWHQRVPANDGGLALGQIMALTMGSRGA